MRRIGEAGSFWLSRWQAKTAILDPDGSRWDDLPHLRQQRCGAQGVDAPILLGQGERLPARLLALPVPHAVADRRRQLKRTGQRHGYTPRQATLDLAAWTLLVTNVPAARLSLADAVVLLRARWQLELLFKRWKSLGQLDTWRTRQIDRIQCELYAKLIGLVLSHWLVVLGCWHLLHHSLAKADTVVRQHARLLAQTFGHARRFAQALARLLDGMTVACQLDRRRGHPNTQQLLLDPTLAGLPWRA